MLVYDAISEFWSVLIITNTKQRKQNRKGLFSKLCNHLNKTKNVNIARRLQIRKTIDNA